MSATQDSVIADLLRDNAALRVERDGALAREAALAEVLDVINRSPSDPGPVFEMILQNAHELCGADAGALMPFDGSTFRAVATLGQPEEFAAMPRQPFRGASHERLIQGERFVHVEDARAVDWGVHGAVERAFVERTNLRSSLFVPLRKDGALLGFISAGRHEVRAFSDTEIALLESFAAQAVIAMENARLLTEQREALEQQTATAEVLRVINASPGDLQPVFDAILEKAHALCGAVIGSLMTYDGVDLHARATLGYLDDHVALIRAPHKPNSYHRRLIEGERVIHIPDLRAIDVSGETGVTARMPASTDVRTSLIVPLRKDGVFVGYISANRREVRLFSDKEIALLENFAAQAVIAMENARLLGELRQRTGALQQSLEYQTATSDVLKVISQATFDIQPVFDTIIATAARLCEADAANIANRDWDGYRIVAAFSGSSDYGGEIGRVMPVNRQSVSGRAVLTGQAVQVENVAADPDYAFSDEFRRLKLGTIMSVPLLRDGAVIGTINLGRSGVRPYSTAQIELVRTFADQAVIAIENARLMTEQREALEQQTATAELLQIINESPGNLQPVFDAMLEKAMQLCGIAFGFLSTWDGEVRHVVAARGLPPAITEYAATRVASTPSPTVLRMLETRRPHQIPDLMADDGYRDGHPDSRAIVDLGGVRTGLHIPLVKDDAAIGIFTFYRRDVREFSGKEIALLESFAAQAVIAMENARLIEEIRAARDHAEISLRDLKIAQANLVQAEKMASLGQLTAGIAHEIKNPLNFINNFAALAADLLIELKGAIAEATALLGEKNRGDVEDTIATLTLNLERIVHHGKRADNIVKSMLEHSRGASGERRTVDLNALADDALNLAYHGARAQDQSFNVTQERHFAEAIAPIELNPQDVTRVLLNLFGNGFYAVRQRQRDAAEPGYEPTISVATADLGPQVEVRVRDNGTGVPAAIRDKLFEPFFTTKPTGEGTGLGLSITYDIVTKQHGGSIAVESEEGAWTEFTVRLPRVR